VAKESFPNSVYFSWELDVPPGLVCFELGEEPELWRHLELHLMLSLWSRERSWVEWSGGGNFPPSSRVH
jgi:hypothetical protein